MLDLAKPTTYTVHTDRADAVAFAHMLGHPIAVERATLGLLVTDAEHTPVLAVTGYLTLIPLGNPEHREPLIRLSRVRSGDAAHPADALLLGLATFVDAFIATGAWKQRLAPEWYRTVAAPPLAVDAAECAPFLDGAAVAARVAQVFGDVVAVPERLTWPCLHLKNDPPIGVAGEFVAAIRRALREKACVTPARAGATIDHQKLLLWYLRHIKNHLDLSGSTYLDYIENAKQGDPVYKPAMTTLTQAERNELARLRDLVEQE